MFTVLYLRKSETPTDEELNWIQKMLSQYALTDSGLWLQSLPWTRFEFRWCPEMNVNNGVMGCFTPLHPDKIFLQRFDTAIKNPDGRIDWIEQIFSTIVHELRHAHQWKKSKIAYLLCSLPVLRQYTLETDAEHAEEQAEDFALRWTHRQNFIYRSQKNKSE